MLRIVRSNRAEPLAERLGAHLAAAPLEDPFAAEVVAVPSRGMERWLAQRLSGVLGATNGEAGVCANVEFPFPGVLVRRLLDAAAPPPTDEDPWAPDRLAWSALALLPRLLDRDAFTPVRHYLRGPEGLIERRRFPLARRIADLFDRYALYRPELLAGWTTDNKAAAEALPPSQRWQTELWHALRSHLDQAPDPVRRFATAADALRNNAFDRTHLPERLAVFGVGQLPPAHLALLESAAHHLDVTLYVLSPSRPGKEAPAGDRRNPLVASLGRLATGFEQQLADGVGTPPTDEHWVDPGEQTLLSALQSDLLADRRRGPAAAGQEPPITLQAVDESLQIHACHGRTRQVEVLRDTLLRLLDTIDGLEPRDIAVLTPGIEAYAPLVTAVFSGGEQAGAPRHDGTPYLPFRIADRSVRAANPVAETLSALLDLVDSRVEASAVLDLLGTEPIRERFRLTAEELIRIRGWVDDAGIRWGIDGAHRASLGQPGDDIHTWRFGLDRLMLGVAMADDGERHFRQVVPYDDMEGDDVDRLNRFAACADTLFANLRDLQPPRPIADWRTALNRALDELIAAPSDAGWQIRQVRDSIDALVDASRGARGCPNPLPLTLDELRAALGDRLGQPSASAAYRTGGVTFSGLIPLRGVPHRVVCLLGMDDDAFPRAGGGYGFDLLAADPRPGVPDPREEDRQLFLDAVGAARDALVVTYTGRDPRTNEERQPAVPVAELLDVAAETVDDPDTLNRIVRRHRLQAFDPENFDAAAPISHDTSLLAAARQLQGSPQEALPFVEHDLPAASDDDAEAVELGALVRFFRDPAAFFLEERLGVRLDEKLDSLEDRDPAVLSGLERWSVGDELLRRRLRDREVGPWRAATLLRGVVPAEALGRYELEALEATVDEILTLADAVEGEPRDVAVDVPLAVTIHGETRTRRLVGTVTGVVGSTVFEAQFAKASASARLRLWIELLAVTATDGEAAANAVLVCREGKEAERVDIAALDDDAQATAQEHLATLVTLFEQGHWRPLPLPPNTSYAYAKCRHEKKGDAAARKDARRNWEAREHEDRQWGTTDLERPATALAFGHLEDVDQLLATDFPELARTVWLPVLRQETT